MKYLVVALDTNDEGEVQEAVKQIGFELDWLNPVTVEMPDLEKELHDVRLKTRGDTARWAGNLLMKLGVW